MSIKRYSFKAIILVIVLFITTVTLPVSAFEPYYDLYAYGDSTTVLSSNYLVQYQSLFEPAKTVSYNTDGSGMNSTWGLETIRDNYHNNATDIFVMFGINDMKTINGTRVGINTDGICDAIEENGSVCHIMIHTMMANDALWGGHSLYEIQVENITDEETYFDSVGRSYVKLYDAIDTIPCNDYPDPVNMSYMRDKVHPSATGHEYMARYLYNRTDYCSIYWSDKGAPVADFTSDVQTGTAPLAVHFTDESTGTGITAWAWDFDNDMTIDATTEDTVHTFATAGTYTVNLTVTNATGSDSEVKDGLITVSGAPVVASKIGVFRPSTQRFYLDTSGDGKWGAGDSQYAFGLPGDLAVSGDWNKDGITEIGVFRPSKQRFYLDTSGDGKWGTGDSQYAFGLPGDLAVSGDWNKDSITEIGVFRPSKQRFYLDTTGNGLWDIGDSVYAFGLTGDLPVAGDWNGDGRDEIGVFRPSTKRFYLDTTGNGLWGAGDSVIVFGLTGDLPVAGDWNGDGKDEIGVFRPITKQFYLDKSGNGLWGVDDALYAIGLADDMPVSGK